MAIAAAVVAIGLVGTGLLGRDQEASRWDRNLPQNAIGGQPLVVPASYGWAIPLSVGQEFTDGLIVVKNQADQPRRIIGVTGEFEESSVAFLGAYVAGTERT